MTLPSGTTGRLLALAVLLFFRDPPRVTPEGLHGYVIGYRRVARRHLTWLTGRPHVTDPSPRAKRAGHELVDEFFVPLDAPD